MLGVSTGVLRVPFPHPAGHQGRLLLAEPLVLLQADISLGEPLGKQLCHPQLGQGTSAS